MKHLVFLVAIFFAAEAAAGERYIVSGTGNTGMAAEQLAPERVIKKLKRGHALSLTAEEAKDLELRGYEVERDELMFSASTPSASTTEILPWGLLAMRTKELWPQQYVRNVRGAGVTVCVVDSGVNPNHSDLRGQVTGGVSTISGVTSWHDDRGHGTHVAGTIAARDSYYGIVGIAPHAKIYAVKVLNSQGSGYTSDIADGIRACIGKSQVVNLSLGGGGYSSYMKAAIDAARSAGLIIVGAAGNAGREGVIYPARYEGVYGVASLGTDWKLAEHSNWGEGIDFIAPGEAILSTIMSGGWSRWNGTSMATPHVAGAFAVMLGAGAKELKADSVGLPLKHQGAGLPNLVKTLQ